MHEDTDALRRMAVFDVLVNNADRKGGHVLAMSDGHRYGVDHGVTFHVEDKLRTVLWGWLGEPLTPQERTWRRARCADALDGTWATGSASCSTPREVDRARPALHAACCAAGRCPPPAASGRRSRGRRSEDLG